MEFERLMFSIEEASVSQCPNCNGIGQRIMSRTAIVGEPWKVRMSPERLPNWHQNNKRAEQRDAWTRYRQKNPLPWDRGSGIKVYESDGLKEPK
jgi:hypothetical protein